jgi:hypothetical protein
VTFYPHFVDIIVSDDVGHSSMLASVELKKRENRDDIDFFTNERLRTLLWYLGTFDFVFFFYQKQVPVVTSPCACGVRQPFTVSQ